MATALVCPSSVLTSDLRSEMTGPGKSTGFVTRIAVLSWNSTAVTLSLDVQSAELLIRSCEPAPHELWTLAISLPQPEKLATAFGPSSYKREIPSSPLMT
jgi:hypothetical protein